MVTRIVIPTTPPSQLNGRAAHSAAVGHMSRVPVGDALVEPADRPARLLVRRERSEQRR